MKINFLFFVFPTIILNINCTPTPSAQDESVQITPTELSKTNVEEKLGIELGKTEILTSQNEYSSYEETKLEVKQIRLNINENEISKDSLSTLFAELLINKIIPYWYGTKWSFEGHTSQPGKGEIACGYFVSTTLKDMGIVINRYKLAQQSPINEARTLNILQPVIEINKKSVKENIIALDSVTNEGVYFIGLDQSHVGYLLKKEGQLFLIHSNYLEARGVEIERLEISEVFSYFEKFYLAEISTNERLLEKWLAQEAVEVIVQ
ncbi:MAG: hypothetical protein DHS20C18_27150 [Saprospiraceae bacterium]|nr:MAG: hypothetical protein DHS20C18_27150 [Saprospiraceae bacterium]